MLSFHEDHLKMLVLALLAVFLGFGWWKEHQEVEHLVEVGSSIGDGWEQCMVSLEPRVGAMEERLAGSLGLRTEAAP